LLRASRGKAAASVGSIRGGIDLYIASHVEAQDFLLPGFVQTIPHRPNARRPPSSPCGMVGYFKALIVSRTIRASAVICLFRASASAE
jgi:hypothetical protein